MGKCKKEMFLLSTVEVPIMFHTSHIKDLIQLIQQTVMNTYHVPGTIPTKY